MNTAPKLTVMSDTRFTPASATPAIEVLSAEKIYSNGTRALLPVNLTINQGEIVTLIGANGAGKSTTLKSIMRLPPPEAPKVSGGDILFKGKSLLNVESFPYEGKVPSSMRFNVE